MNMPNFKRFAMLVIDNAQRARDWHVAKGMKPAETPSMPLSVALSILREAKHSGINVEALLNEGTL